MHAPSGSRGLPGQHMGSNALESLVMMASFIPTSFAIFALGMREEGKEFKDEKGITGAACGIVTLAYVMFYLFMAASKSPDVLKVLVFARLMLGLMFAICGGAIMLVAGKDGIKAALGMFIFAALSFPEAYLVHEYRMALSRDYAMKDAPSTQQMAQLNPPMSQQMAQIQRPPSQQGAAPQSGAYGYGGPPPSGGYGYGGGPPGGFGAPPMRY